MATDNNTVKYFDSDNLLASQNQILTLCCCNQTAVDIDKYWEAHPCEVSFIPRGTVCLEPNVVAYEDRLYVPRSSKCGGGGGTTVCECQTLAWTSTDDIPVDNILAIVTLSQSDNGNHSYTWNATELRLTTNNNTNVFKFVNYFNLNQLATAVNDIGDGWDLSLNSTVYGRYSPGFVEPSSDTFTVDGSPVDYVLNSRQCGLSLRWQGQNTDYIEWSGDLSTFTLELQTALNATFTSENIGIQASSGSPDQADGQAYFLDVIFTTPESCGTVRPNMTVFTKGLIGANDVRFYYGDYENNVPYDVGNWFAPHGQSYFEEPGILKLTFDDGGDRFPQFPETSTRNADHSPRTNFGLPIAGLSHTLGNGFKFCSREARSDNNSNFHGNYPPAHNYEEKCCPQRGATYGPDQRFLTASVSGYDLYGIADNSVFLLDKPRSTFGNLDNTFKYGGACYSISPWYYLYNKEGYNVETDTATRKKLFEISDCQFGSDGFNCDELNHETPNNCYVELFLPQFHPLIPWGPFGAYHSSIITQLHRAYEDENSYISQTYPSNNPVLARYGASYRPWGFIKTHGNWLATESIEVKLSVHRPVPYYVGTVEFDDFNLFATYSNIDSMFRTTANNGCGPTSFWVDQASGYTVGEFVDALNAITIDVEGSSSGVPAFKFALGSQDARNINCAEIINVSSELFDEWVRDPDPDSPNDKWHSNGPIEDDWRFSGADIVIGPLNYESMHGHHPQNLAYYMLKEYQQNREDRSYHANVGVCKIPLHTEAEATDVANVSELQDGANSVYEQLLTSHELDSFMAAPPPFCRRKVGLPKEALDYDILGPNGYVNDELMAQPKLNYGSHNTYGFVTELEYGPYNAQSNNMWFTNIQGRDRGVLTIDEANHGKDLSLLNVEVRSSGNIWIRAVVQESGNNTFDVSGVIHTMPTGTYRLSDAIGDLNDLELSYNFNGVQTFNPVVASSGIWHEIWFDERTYLDGSNENPTYTSGVGFTETTINYSYREPLRDQGPFDLRTRSRTLNTFVRNRCNYVKEEAAPDEYVLESNFIRNLNYYSYPEPDLPPCLPPSALRLDKDASLDCFGDEVVENNWLLSYGCTSYVCNTEWYIKAQRCGCDTLLNCTTRAYQPHPTNYEGDALDNYELYGEHFTVTQPTLYVCNENIHSECDIPMLLKVPFMVYDPETRAVLTYFDDGYASTLNDSPIELSFCTAGTPGSQGDIMGWCQYIDPSNRQLVRFEDIPYNWPPKAYIMRRGYPAFCSVHPWSFDPEGVICTNDCNLGSFTGRCPSCSNYDKMYGITPWYDLSDPDSNIANGSSLTVLARAVTNPTYGEMCGGAGGGCREHAVTCGTKCCGCHFVCDADGCDSATQDKVVTKTTISASRNTEDVYNCQIEILPAGGPGSCLGIGVYNGTCDVLSVGTWFESLQVTYNENRWNGCLTIGLAGGGASCRGEGMAIYNYTDDNDCPDDRGIAAASGCGYVMPYCNGGHPGCPGRGPMCVPADTTLGYDCSSLDSVPLANSPLVCTTIDDVEVSTFSNCCVSDRTMATHCGSGPSDCAVNGEKTETRVYETTIDSCGDGACTWDHTVDIKYEGCIDNACGSNRAGGFYCATGTDVGCAGTQMHGHHAGWEGTIARRDEEGTKTVTISSETCNLIGTPTVKTYSQITGWFDRIGYTLLGGNYYTSTDSGDFGGPGC